MATHSLALETWHCEPSNLAVYFGGGLHVWGENLGVLRQVDQESITCPAPFDFHGFEWGTT